MDNLFANAGVTYVASSSESNARKRQAVQLGQQDKVDEMSVITAKLALSSALKARVMTAATLECYKIETMDEYCCAVKEGVKIYIELSKDLRESKKLESEVIVDKIGIIDCCAFNEVVKVLVKDLKSSDKNELADRVTKAASTWTPQFLAQGISLLPLEKAFDSKFKKLFCRINPAVINKDAPTEMSLTEIWQLVETQFLLKPRNRRMKGVAPPGDLERRLQNMIDSAEGKKD